MSQRTLIVALTVLIVSTPPLAAAWAFHGEYEPSTREDVNDHMMFTAPYTGVENRVYFNGFVEQSCTGAAILNPNVGDSNVRSEIVGVCDNYLAILGVWSDCNHDGYVGLGEVGMSEYRTEVLNAQVPLASQSPECRPQSALPLTDAGRAAWHNDGNWVREYIPIGWSPSDGADADGKENGVVVDNNDFNIDDNSSRVWVDQQLAGTDGGHGACLLGLQTESTQSVGGFLYWADCGTGRTTITTLNLVLNAAGHPELGFSDASKHEYDSQSPLNVWNPYGQQDSPSMVTVWDCNSAKTFAPRDPTSPSEGEPGTLWRVQDPTGTPASPGQLGDNQNNINITFSDGYILYGANVSGIHTTPSTNIPPPNANPGRPGQPSMSGTVNATVSGTDRCARNTDADHGTRADTVSNPYALVESGFPAAAVKTTTHDTLTPQGNRRAGQGAWLKVNDPTSKDPNAFLVNQSLPEPLGPTTGVTTEGAGGVATIDVPFNTARVDPLRSFLGLWRGGGGFVVEGPGLDSNNGKTTGIQYNRYYAYVSPQSYLTLPPGGTRTYGGNDEVTGTPPECGGNIIATPAAAPTFTNVFNDWDCKTGDWYQDLTGGDLTPRSSFLGCDRQNEGPNQNDRNLCKMTRVGAVVGDAYNMKDLDCWDMSAKPARDQGVSLGLIGDWGGNPLTPAQCDTAP